MVIEKDPLICKVRNLDIFSGNQITHHLKQGSDMILGLANCVRGLQSKLLEGSSNF